MSFIRGRLTEVAKAMRFHASVYTKRVPLLGFDWLHRFRDDWLVVIRVSRETATFSSVLTPI